jgi:FdrA protein
VSHKVRLLKDAYVDSVLQMAATRAMREVDGVEWATAAMATPANVAVMEGEGFDLAGAGANDCVLAARAGDDEAAEAALAAGDASLGGGASRGGVPGAIGVDRAPASLEEAVAELPDANLAIVSVPGDFAALEAHKALTAGLHVLLFSDNVSVEEEIELKERGSALGRLVMGPGAGTAVLGGCGLGFANAVRRGRVGVVAAAGTGAQEVMCLLDRWGAGVSAVIGVGGRDLSEAVGGRMARLAVATLRHDPGTDVILLVSKPPSPEVARAVVAEAGDKPLAAALIGLTESIAAPSTVHLATTLEEGALLALELAGQDKPDPAAGGLAEAVAAACAGVSPERRLVRGLYSGGTLCYEAMVLLSGVLGPIHSNTPLRKGWDVPAPPGSHVCLDLGEEEYTKGRPHPMIDPSIRLEYLAEEGRDPATAVVLLDVVLGYGANDDPAGALAPVCAQVRAGGAQVVAYVLGTEADHQGLAAQQATLAEAGCLVAPTAARAALAAAAIATRRPELVLAPAQARATA